jgi:hypothetical protein
MMRSTPVRILLSAFAGFVSFYAVAAFTLFFGHGSSSLFDRYHDVFGLATVIGRLVDPYFYPAEELGSNLAYQVAGVARICLWSLFFGFLYFRFVFRARRTI